jgi:hypothetical protein
MYIIYKFSLMLYLALHTFVLLQNYTQTTGYKCTVTITAIHESPRWWYVGCAKCGKAPDIEMIPFRCSRCYFKDSKPL